MPFFCAVIVPWLPSYACPTVSSLKVKTVSLTIAASAFNHSAWHRVNARCRLNVYLPEIHMLKTNVLVFGGRGFGRLLGVEGRALMFGINVLIIETRLNTQKRPQRDLLPLSPCEVTRRLWTRTQSLSSHWICWCLDLGLSASRTMRNTFLLFKSPCLWHFCYSSSNRLRQCSINTFEWIKKWAESETAEMGNRSWSKRSGLFQLLFFVVTLSCWMFLPTIHWMTGGINNKKKVWSPIHEEQGILCSCSSLYFPSCSPQRGPCSRPPTLPAFCGDQAWALQSYPGLTSGSYWNDLPTMRETQVQSLGWKDPLEKGMAAHTSILIWRITWTEETGRLQSMGSQRIGHDRVTNTLSIIELFRGFSGLKNEIPAATCCHLSCVRYCTLHFFFLSSNH